MEMMGGGGGGGGIIKWEEKGVAWIFNRHIIGWAWVKLEASSGSWSSGPSCPRTIHVEFLKSDNTLSYRQVYCAFVKQKIKKRKIEREIQRGSNNYEYIEQLNLHIFKIFFVLSTSI